MWRRMQVCCPRFSRLLASACILISQGCEDSGPASPSLTKFPGENPTMPSGGNGQGGSTGEDLNPDCEAITPGQASSRLLTNLQYTNTVQDLLGNALPASAAEQAAAAFPDENTFLGFGNNADVHRASLLLSEQHAVASQQLAALAVDNGVSELIGCDDESASCVRQFIERFGLRAFRRPLTDDEVTPLEELFNEAQSQWGFGKAIELVLRSILQSPQFLYRTESLVSLTQGSVSTDTTERGAEQDIVALDSYQIASRLSFFLWNSMPDAELFALAKSGELQDLERVQEQARRLLLDPRARTTVSDFFRQWLGVYRFSGLARQVDEQGVFLNSHNDDWEQSLERFAQHTFWQEGGTLTSLLTSDAVFLQNPATAALYNLEPSDGSELVRDPNRRGLLTQPGLLALLSHPDQSAPIQRGKFVREQLLCQPLLPPPPTVDASPPDPDPNATTRERFAEHTGQTACSGCHRLIDGLGFGLEGFDHLGRFRSEENGLPIDTSGEIQGSLEDALDGPYQGASELSDKLANSSQVQDCLATQWFRYTMGRAEQQTDSCNLEAVQEAFRESDGDFRDLFVALTLTDAFRFRPAGDQDL